MTEFNLKHGDLVYYPGATNSPIRVVDGQAVLEEQ